MALRIYFYQFVNFMIIIIKIGNNTTSKNDIYFL